MPFAGTEPLLGEVTKFWGWMAATVTQHCERARGHLQIVKRANLVYTLPQLKTHASHEINCVRNVNGAPTLECNCHLSSQQLTTSQVKPCSSRASGAVLLLPEGTPAGDTRLQGCPGPRGPPQPQHPGPWGGARQSAQVSSAWCNRADPTPRGGPPPAPRARFPERCGQGQPLPLLPVLSGGFARKG